MLNSQFANSQAQVFADNAVAAAGADPAGRVSYVLRRVLQREPTAAEIDRGVKFVGTLVAEHQLTAEQALTLWCLAVLNSNEFLYLD